MLFGFNLPHYVNHIRLKRTDALLPLFEAVINSVQAVKERGVHDGAIDIHIHREPQTILTETTDLPLILGFSVTDNGIGFTDENMESFTTFSSRLNRPSAVRGSVVLSG